MYIRLSLILLLLAKSFAFSEVTEMKNEKIISLQRAISLAVENNPELVASDFKLKAAGAFTKQAGLFPNPQLSLEIDGVEGDGAFEGYQSRERTVMLSSSYGMGRKRTKRKELARCEENLVYRELTVKKLILIADTKKAFYSALGAQEIFALDEELFRLAESMYSAVSARVDAGKVSPLEKIKAHAVLLRQKLELARSEKAYKASKLHLASLWGSSVVDFSGLEGNLAKIERLPDVATLLERAEKNPELLRSENEVKYSKAAIKLEKSMRLPDIEIGAGYRDFNDSGEHAFVVELSFPLNIFNRNQGNINAATYGLSKAKEEQKATHIEIQKELLISCEEAQNIFDEITMLKNEIVSGTEEVFNATLEGYRLGKFGYLAVLDSQQMFFESRRNYLESLVTYQVALAEIEYLVGGELALDDEGEEK